MNTTELKCPRVTTLVVLCLANYKKKTTTFPNNSCHKYSSSICLDTKPWLFRDKPSLHVVELACFLITVILFSSIIILTALTVPRYT